MTGVRFAAGGGISTRHHVQTDSTAHTASYPVGTESSFSEVKRPGSEANHSPPCNAEVRNACSYTSTPQYAFMAWYLIKQIISLRCTGQLYLSNVPSDRQKITAFCRILTVVC
jgi:hypothetical protein